MANRIYILLGCLLVFFAPVIPVQAEEGTRESAALPAEVRDAFLAEMRGHMGNLDDILAALEEVTAVCRACHDTFRIQ